MLSLKRRAPDLLAALFGLSGTAHLARPALFTPLIPQWLPRARDIVFVSGIIELVCAVGLARRTPWAGRMSAALLVAVFPGNVQMARTAFGEQPGEITVKKVATLARLPLQAPLIWAALQASTSPLPRSRDIRVGGGR